MCMKQNVYCDLYVSQLMEKSYSAADLMAWSGSAWLLPSFSSLPVHHIESWNVGREREIILAQWEIDPMSAAGHIGVAPIAMAASAVNKAMQCWKTIMDWIESAGDCETSPIASPFASLLLSPRSRQERDQMKRSNRCRAAAAALTS